MPIINAGPNRVRSVRHTCSLQEQTRGALVQYGLFIGDSVDYELNRLIETTLAKDRDFIVWRADHPSEPTAAQRVAPLRPTARRWSGARRKRLA
jgi:hypothetical protein